MNTKSLVSASLVAVLAAGPAIAGSHRYDAYDHDRFESGARARVVDVKPIVVIDRIPVSHRKCRDEEVWHRSRDTGVSSGEGLIAGSIIGGVIGNQAFHGRGRNSATIAGTVIGAMVGHALASDDEKGSYRTVEERCDIRRGYREEERVVGYDVTYRYCGKLYTTRMDHDPGDWIRLRVEPY